MATTGRHFCNRFRIFLRYRTTTILLSDSKNYSQRHKLDLSKDKEIKLFLRDDVQQILKRITQFDVHQTFASETAVSARRPKYQIFKDEELEGEMSHAKEMAESRLQMPPYMDVRASHNKVLASDPDLAPILNSKFVFVDISQKNKRIPSNAERPIVCRHETGELRLADWGTVDRVSQIYNPISGREVFTPKMFQEEHLEEILDTQKYTYILERTCTQFEPDSSDFIRVTHRIYEHVFQHNNYHALTATRFFGPMTFYLTRMKKIEPLLVYLIDNDRISDATDVINLQRIMTNQPVSTASKFSIISNFNKTHANKKYVDDLEKALVRYSSRTHTSTEHGVETR